METNIAQVGKNKQKGQVYIQKFGRFLSGMVMPNIGAFIAWGFITALFIPTGWFPNESLGNLVGPMISYLLPVLIGYTGGKMVAGARGGVLGAIATMGVIVGADIPMFIGAMIMGPLAGYVIKKVDETLQDKIPAGFEMLVNNFTAGIIGAIMALLAYVAIGPVVLVLNNAIKAGVEAILNIGLLPITSLFIEPAKILFLNNALNHGVLSPMGIQQAEEIGKSIFFLLETNPGPGLGLLLAYWVFAKGMIKQSAPGAIIIHFLGGIHEIYFPYVLMNPILIAPVILGGATGVLTFSILGAGLVATPSPGSIVALMAMTPKGGLFPVLAGVLMSTIVTFLAAAPLIKRRSNVSDDQSLEDAKSQMKEMKNQTITQQTSQEIKKIVFACDAGMGSSAMGATKLRKKLKQAGLNIEVVNEAIDHIPEDAQIVITQETLTPRAASVAPHAEHISIQDFIQTPAYDLLVKRVAEVKGRQEEIEEEENLNQPVLQQKNIKLGLSSTDKFEAIKMAGQLLVDSGYVKEDYIEAMIQRENDLTTYIGGGVAIPHGVGAAKKEIKKTGISILQFPEGIDFGEEKAYLVIGIAGVGNEHLSILANLATVIEEEEVIERLKTTSDIEYVYDTFTQTNFTE